MRPIKRGFLIGPWGVGAIVPFPNNESLMIAGLDVWEYKGFERDLGRQSYGCHRILEILGLPPQGF